MLIHRVTDIHADTILGATKGQANAGPTGTPAP